MRVLPVEPSDRGWVEEFIRERWGSATVVAHGVVYAPATLDGFVAWDGKRRIGLVTYRFDVGCEIVTIDPLEQGRGIGTALVDAVGEAARTAGREYLWLITTNENHHAQGWYRRRGFEVVAVHEGAVERSRVLKPEIPLVDPDTGEAIRDEIEIRRPVEGP
jgi:ribosomal protein S18 acetylase RimI-like enzyme